MIIGYLDKNGKNIEINKQHKLIEQYAQIKDLVIDVFSSDDVNELVNGFQTYGHTIIFPNIVCLGSSLYTIKENLTALANKKITTICIKENLIIAPGKETDWLIKGLEISIDIRNSMISTITKSALHEKKANGTLIGRAPGSKNKKRVWSGKEEDIKQKLASGLSRTQIAKEVGISTMSLYNFLRQYPELRYTNGGSNA